MIDKEKIQALSGEIFEQVVGFRQHIHANPELSYKEFKTSAYIKGHLTDWGIPYSEMANTGIVGLITGDLPSDRVIALRADMDALPIVEANVKPYVSQNPGVMHACGHDVHSSSLLGTAFILNSLKAEFGGTIKLIFQPAEEMLPGGAS
ncbi:MAG TPA: amidohydrolase, partial [Pedobacter sp.]